MEWANLLVVMEMHIRENSKKGKKAVWEFYNIKMGTYMRENLKVIKNMVQELLLCKMEIFIQENGNMDLKMEEVNMNLHPKMYTKGIG